MTTTEDNSGWRKILSSGVVYKIAQFIFNEKKSKQFMLDNYVLPQGPNFNMLDIGCGPGNLLEFMPNNFNYIGFDVNENYILTAQAKNIARQNTTFILGFTEDMFDNAKLPDSSMDIAIVNGVFHHVTDAIASEMLDLAGKKLKKGGRMLVIEPSWFSNQSAFRKWVMSKDRGKNIKHELDWKSFFSECSSNWADIKFEKRSDLTRFYDLLVIELVKR